MRSKLSGIAAVRECQREAYRIFKPKKYFNDVTRRKVHNMPGCDVYVFTAPCTIQLCREGRRCQ
eukprot:12886877-Prorocentrum_lima.AAC.1